MKEPVSDASNIGVTVALLAIVFAVVLGIAKVSINIINKNTTKFQAGVEGIANQEWLTYDQTKVSGAQVKAAAGVYVNGDYMIIVQNKNNQVSGATVVANAYGFLPSGQSDHKMGAINITKKTGDTFYTGTLGSDNFYDISKMSDKTDSDHNVNDAGTFESYLIKDSNGNIIGLYFKQIS